jgi:hypothetical protein
MAGLSTNAWPTLRDYVKTDQTIREAFKSAANGANTSKLKVKVKIPDIEDDIKVAQTFGSRLFYRQNTHEHRCQCRVSKINRAMIAGVASRSGHDNFWS